MSPRTRTLALGLAAAALVVVAAVAALAFFDARDDSTVTRADGPGSPRPDGADPAVRTGNVLLLYRDRAAAPALDAVRDELSGPPDPALVAAGQAVIVRREPRLAPAVRALSASHRVDAASSDAPAIRDFVDFWLGRSPR